MTLSIVTASLVFRTIEVADAIVVPSTGSVEAIVGYVLSMRTFERSGLVPVWPVPSVATARKS